MKNITVAVDDETYKRARTQAAKSGTSVSALVRRFLIELASGDSENERLKRRELKIRETIKEFSASDRLSREDIYSR